MWILVLPLLIVAGAAIPYLLSKSKEIDGYVALDADANSADDVEMAASQNEPTSSDNDVLTSTVCDVAEWLEEARDRLDICSNIVTDRVDTGAGQATRITFELSKFGRREIWVDGPSFMLPLPRIRDVAWESADAGIHFLRTAAGVEKSVLESCAKRTVETR